MSLLGLSEMSAGEMQHLLQLSRDLDPCLAGPYQAPSPYAHSLRGRVVGLLFFETSTRTRSSFELAVHHLGGYPLVLSIEGSSVKKGETELDTCRNLRAMGVQAFVVRHSSYEVMLEIHTGLDVPVINAGVGCVEHPTQALLDLRTLQDALDCRDFEGKKIAIIGDIVHSRVARSNVYGFSALGAEVVLAGPESLLPPEEDRHGYAGARFVTSRAEALADADAVMMLRIQKERIEGEVDLETFISKWRVDQRVVESEMKPGVPILHPGPVLRGEELTSEVIDGPRSLILRQVRNGVAVRQAVLYHTLV